MTDLINPDDASSDYMAGREQVTADATVDAFMNRMNNVDITFGSSKEPTEAAVPAKTEERGIGDRVLGVAKDVGLGVVEAPKQIIGGISDMVHNTFMAADSLANWLNENVADLRIDVPKTGVGAVDELVANPAKAIAGKKGEVAKPASTTGGLVREATRFLSGFKLAKGAMGIEGVGFGAIPAGAISDFLGQDPDAARLADLWKAAGLPENVLTSYLESDPTDSEIEKRFKQALEGAALGTLTEGVFRGAKYLRSKWQARQGAQNAGVQQLDELAAAPKVTDRDFMLLGDPNEPLMKVSRAAPDDAATRAAGKIAKSMKDTETGVPDSVTAKGIVGSAKDIEPLPLYHQTSPDLAAKIKSEGFKIGEALSRRNDDTLPDAIYLKTTSKRIPLPESKSTQIKAYLSPGAKGKTFENREALETYLRKDAKYAKLVSESRAEDKNIASMMDDILYDRNPEGAKKILRDAGYDENTINGLVKSGSEERPFGPLVDEAFEVLSEQSRTTKLPTAARERATQILREEGLDYIRVKDDRGGLFGKASVDTYAVLNPEKISTSPPRVSALAAKETVGEPSVTINFARMDTPEHIKQVFRDTAEAFSGQIDEARRGVITLDETAAMAKRLGMTPEDLIARTKGQAFNAEQIKAAGTIMDSATAKLFEIAEKAASPTASDVDHYMLRKMLAVHQAIQGEFLGAVAEAGRALNAIKIAQQGGSIETARAIQGLVQGMGGPEVGRALAQRLVLLKQVGAEEAVAQFARKGVLATSVDAVKEYWVNSLLSSPTTHIVNTASNSMVVAMSVAERRVGELISQAAGRPGIETGEAAAMLYGLKEGWRDAFRSAWKAARTGESDIGKTLGKMDLPHGQFSGGAQNAFSARAFGLNEAGAAGRVVDFIGSVTRTPGRLLMTEDEFFKTIGYRMELHAQSFRQAAAEGLQGEALGRRMAQIMADPPEVIRLAAADAALYNTFTNATGWFGQELMKLRTQGGSANPIVFILPFVRTPANIARFAFERSILAPAVRQWRADIAAGGARADLALARMGTGTAIMFLTSDLAMSGNVSGRGPKAAGEREAMMRQGWRPYSIRVGDRWYSYNRSDPFGMTMGFAADFTEAMNRGEIDPDDVDEWQEVAASMIGSVAQVSISKTYMRGLSEFFEMMGDPTRYAPNQINRFIASFVPAGAAAVERLVDPVTREAFDPLQAIQARIAGLSDKLIPARDLWGEERKPRSGLGTVYDTFSPVYASEVRDSPIDREIVRLVADVRRIGKKTSFQGVDVNFRDWPEVYDAYVRMAGNELQHPAWGMGAKDYLDAVVTGRHPMSEVYALKSDGRDGGKSEFIRDTVRSYRQLAQRRIMEMSAFADFRDFIEGRKIEKRARAMPGGIELPAR